MWDVREGDVHVRKKDSFYLYLLTQCQSADLQQRLDALRDLGRHDYLDLVDAQFLLDRLNSTSDAQEQAVILRLMGQVKKPLPVDALMAILADWETSPILLRMGVAHILVVVRAEEAFELLLRLLLDCEEHPWLREVITCDLATWGEHLSRDILLTLLADPDPAVCTAALEALRERPSQTLPLEIVSAYCTHERGSIREAAIKTLLVTEQRVPLDLILSALNDPEPQVRAAASHGCISLVEWFGDQLPLEPLVQALNDDNPTVREDLLDTLGKAALRAPVEPVIAALTDPIFYVRCAAVETLGLMGERVPSSVYSMLQEMSGSDISPHVRQRATRTLLLLHGMTSAPLKPLTIDLMLEELED